VTVKERDLRTGEEPGETETFFRAVFVFGRAQVDQLPSAEPAPLKPPSQPVTGDSHGRLLARCNASASRRGTCCPLSRSRDRRAAGATRSQANRRRGFAGGEPQLRTLIQETAPARVDPQRHSGPQAEVILDTVVSAPVARNRGSGAGLNE
jgi:hypothetical protein